MDAKDFGLDLVPVFAAVDRAEVLIVRFPFIAHRLLVDLRADDQDPPVITLLPAASGIEERFRSVLEARPRLPVPERIISFHWPRRAAALKDSGIWERIRARLAESGDRRTDDRCAAAWELLLREERREEMVAIRGSDRYETLWQRDGA